MILLPGKHRPGRLAALLTACSAAAGAVCQTNTPTSSPAVGTFDACGTLVQAGRCVLFAGGGGQYVLSDYGNFHVGDSVRVVGELAANCTTICGQTDGCIRGAVLYDPAVLPCGTHIPSLPGDLITSGCTAASAAIAGGLGAGLWLNRGRGRVRAKTRQSGK
jgi:hypothetical protein